MDYQDQDWMEPDKPPIETTGTCEQKLALDGHYLPQVYTGKMMGLPFTCIKDSAGKILQEMHHPSYHSKK